MIYFYSYLFLFQFLNTYLSFLTVLNPYVFSLLFIFNGFTKTVKKINIKILAVLFFIIVAFLIIYSLKFSFAKSFLITAKAIQFNYGYYLLIPGITALMSFFPKLKLNRILKLTFWILSIELLIEFVLIRILGVSPGSFTHYPKVSHITQDKITGEYTANRLLGLAGNASVMGVIYSASFVFYFGSIYSLNKKIFTKETIPIIITFIACFFMIISGSAFFAIITSLFIVWSIGKGNLLKNLLIGLILFSIILFLFNYLSTITDAFGDKFTVEYLLFLLTKDDIQGSLPYLIADMSVGYHWYNFFIGTYFFEWGNPDAIIKTVDFFYANVVYEFGLIGLAIFFYPIKIAYDVLSKSDIDKAFVRMGFLVLVVGSLHYPSIAYMSAQVFISFIAAIAIRDRNLQTGNFN